MPITFIGGSPAPDVIAVADRTVASFTVGQGATASFSLESDGDIIAFTTGTGGIDVGNWIAPAVNAGLYEVQVTVTGDTPSGTVGSYVALSSTRTWAINSSVGNSKATEMALTIRRISGSVVVDTATINLETQAESGA